MGKSLYSFFWCAVAALIFWQSPVLNAQEFTPWKWSHQTPQGNTLNWLKVWDANNWYAVGANGTFMKTTNGGSTWYFHHKAGIPLTTGTGATTTLNTAWFFDMNTGVAVGTTTGSQQFVRTTNGGVTWDSASGSLSGPSWSDLYFINSLTGFAAGTTSGRFAKTTDGGQNWVVAGATIPTLPSGTYNTVFAWDADNIIIGASGSNLRKSTDGGLTWTLHSASPTSTMNKMRFIDANTGFAVGSAGAVWVSTNGGVNWTSKPTGNSSAYQNVVFKSAPAPLAFEQSFTDTSFPPAGWDTINTLGGKSWNRSTTSPFTAPAASLSDWESTGGIDWMITSQIPVISGDSLVFWARRSYTGAFFNWDTMKVMVSSTTQDTSAMSQIFIMGVNVVDTSLSTYPPRLGEYQRFAISLNSYAGQSVYIGFRHHNLDGTGLRVDDISVGLNRPSNITEAFIVGDAFNIYRTSNLGDSYTPMPFLAPVIDQPWTSTYYDLGFAGDTMVTVGGSGLINKSINGGANWSALTTYIKAGTFNDVWGDPNTGRVIAIGAPGSAGNTFDQVMISTNRGASWTVDPVTGSTATFNCISMINSTTGFIAGTTGRLRKTTNAGATWDSIATGITFTINRVNFVDANTGWIFGSTGLISKTTDGGATWTPQTSNVGTGAINGSAFIDANTGFFVSTTGRARRTTDGGTNWDTITTNYGSTLNDIVMVNSNTGYMVGLAGNMRKTTDGGTTWDTVATPVSTTLNDVRFFDANYGIIGGLTGYSARTLDGGQTWIMSNTGGGTVNALTMVHPDTAFAVGLTGAVHKLADGTTGTSIYTSHIPERYFLDQNYPNPFNPTTTIKFGLPREGTVSLKIYDMAGREVANLFNNVRLNPGQVSHTFNGSALASGVYFYTLIVDNNLIATKKMVLVK